MVYYQNDIALETNMNLELLLPDYETQVRVGKVLSAFDDKIELNTQINHKLEGIAA